MTLISLFSALLAATAAASNLPHKSGLPPMPFHHGPPNTYTPSNYSEAKRYIRQQQYRYERNTAIQLAKEQSSCDWKSIGIRRAWDDLKEDERASYISAVKCVATLPAQTNQTLVPGARTRIDDFVWQHISQTNLIHVSGLLLPWHRQFIWSWEQLLRNECGYDGFLPYWPWERHADNQSKSPVWQPGNNSFGTNGKYVPHPDFFQAFVGLPVPFNVTRKAGNGGGCIQDGAFSEASGWKINLGPISSNNITASGANNSFGQQYNPRCVTQDILQEESTSLLNYSMVATLLQQDNIHTFHPVLENNGVHIGGHFYMGGDGGDVYASPNEPVFWLHHANIDRLWSIWQGQDLAGRENGLDGTLTIANIPPSANATLDSIMHMGLPAGGDLPIRYAMSPTKNDYCYMYV